MLERARPNIENQGGRAKPVDISKLLEKARAAAEKRNYEYAIDLYRQGAKMDPDNVACRRELRAVEIRMCKEKPPGFLEKAKLQGHIMKSHTMMTAKKYDSAIDAAEDALQIDPGNVRAAMALALALSTAGHKQTAIATYEDLRTVKCGGDVKALGVALKALGFAYKDAQRFKDAQEIFSELMRIDPSDRDAAVEVRNLSASQMANKIQDQTKDAKDGKGGARMIQKGKDDSDRAGREAHEIRSDEELKLAIQDAKADIVKKPDDARVHAKLGDLYKRGNNYADAKKCYEDARSKESTNWMWKFKLDDLEIWKSLLELNEMAGKIKAGDNSLREQYVKSRAKLLEYRLASFQEREKQYATDGKIRFELAGIYYDLAEVSKNFGLYDEAIKRYQVCWDDPKYKFDAGVRLGVAFTRKGQFELALKRVTETLAKMPEVKDMKWKELNYVKADILETSGKPSESLQTFLQIYEVDVSYKDVGKRVEKLQKAG